VIELEWLIKASPQATISRVGASPPLATCLTSGRFERRGRPTAMRERGQLALDRRMGLGVALPAVGALEAAALPDRCRWSSAVGEISDFEAPRLVHLGGLEGAAHNRTKVADHDLESLGEIGQHLDHANAVQVQAYGHRVRHGPLLLLGCFRRNRVWRGSALPPRIWSPSGQAVIPRFRGVSSKGRRHAHSRPPASAMARRASRAELTKRTGHLLGRTNQLASHDHRSNRCYVLGERPVLIDRR
jgi:hypothetical protein